MQAYCGVIALILQVPIYMAESCRISLRYSLTERQMKTAANDQRPLSFEPEIRLFAGLLIDSHGRCCRVHIAGLIRCGHQDRVEVTVLVVTLPCRRQTDTERIRPVRLNDN